ncbi:hypothetical protein [Methylobacterium sp. J-076]|uniref:hypothetical protein n=1 Tax=Methylobacterium sp. J-076 TaxID=2836655 RepID=UPI001FBB689B|nr:hypothetical protein [Methylobacterium sp. J-076]MCJ2015583.1 hypothetical protein [Methylobacterium sp. J-076]
MSLPGKPASIWERFPGTDLSSEPAVLRARLVAAQERARAVAAADPASDVSREARIALEVARMGLLLASRKAIVALEEACPPSLDEITGTPRT